MSADLVAAVVALAALSVTLLVVLGVFTKNMVVAAPNEAAIFSGRKRTVAGRAVGYVCVRGGRRLRMPLLETVDLLDLSTFTIDVNLVGASCRGCLPVNVKAVATVKIAGEEPVLGNAVERLLGYSREQVHHIAKELLEGGLRGALSSMTPAEAMEDRLKLDHILQEHLEPCLERMGLVLDTYEIQQVEAEPGYADLVPILHELARLEAEQQAATAAETEAPPAAAAPEPPAQPDAAPPADTGTAAPRWDDPPWKK